MTIHLVIPDPHCHPAHDNKRADWLANLIIDIRPDVVVNLGDQFDMASLSGYDKGKRSFVGRSYSQDIQAGIDFSERLWNPVRATKKRMPYRIVFEGNHEHRIERMLDLQPELEGTVGFDDYRFQDYYNDVVRYEGGTPGVREIDGIHYAHYHISGVMGRAISGEHPAYSLLSKLGSSSTVGHLHTTDYCVRTNIDGLKRQALIAGCFFSHDNDWAGVANNLYWRGVIVKRNVENGSYDPEWISLDQLEKEYS